MMYTDVCTDEIMVRVDLLDIRNTFSDMVFDNGGFFSIRIVEIQCFFGGSQLLGLQSHTILLLSINP